MVFWFINYTMWGITASIFNLYCLQRRIKNDYRLKEYFHSELKILITLTLSSTHQGEKKSVCNNGLILSPLMFPFVISRFLVQVTKTTVLSELYTSTSSTRVLFSVLSDHNSCHSISWSGHSGLVKLSPFSCLNIFLSHHFWFTSPPMNTRMTSNLLECTDSYLHSFLLAPSTFLPLLFPVSIFPSALTPCLSLIALYTSCPSTWPLSHSVGTPELLIPRASPVIT